MNVSVEDFRQEIACFYKDERYSVRDNGAVFRHPIEGKRQRISDNNWTFGKLNNKTGYLEIASNRVHRIVATAFHGDPPTKEHVVDHIDTNRQNNRPENLRWVTRLENVLLNPITAKRIEIVCGSVEAFLSEPAKFRDKFQDPNYEWMCTVNFQEAKASKARLLAWASSDKRLQGGSLGDWIYNRGVLQSNFNEMPEVTNSLTNNASQKNWKTPSEFPCCPKEISNRPIKSYAENLREEEVFSQNQFLKTLIQEFALSKDETILWVVSKNSDEKAVKPFSLAEITFKDDYFVHNNLGSFFKKDGVEKQLTLAQGHEWTKGDTFDDFC